MNILSLLARRFPRLSLLVYWIVRPGKLAAPYGGHRTWPVLGLLFQPRSTLEFVVPGTAGRQADSPWLSVVLGFLGDLVGPAYRLAKEPIERLQSDSRRAS